MLSLAPRSGYDIKRVVDGSTRFFWAASYGQIYPELNRLADADLIRGESAARGGRKRTVYHLTPAGRQALREWLLSPGLTYELRDEGLLKLFFADALSMDEALGLIRAKREQSEGVLATLRAVEPRARDRGGFAYRVWQGGYAIHSRTVEWCEAMEREVRKEGKG
jgi:PadR family transcriptional regulator, regulatory protein AphA